MHKRIINSITTLLVTLIVIIVSEIFLAKFYRKEIIPYRYQKQGYRRYLEDEAYLESTETMTFQLKKNYSGRFSEEELITTDRYGFRVDRDNANRLIEKIDILCMGDSFIFGILVDDTETFPYYLNEFFSFNHENILVANAGYSGGISFDTAYVAYKKDYYKFNPKIIIYGLYGGNDFFDIGIWTKLDGNGMPDIIRDVSEYETKFCYAIPLLRESRLFVGLAQIFSKWRYRDVLRRHEENRWINFDRIIEDWKRLTKENGTKLIFLFINPPDEDHTKTYLENNNRFKVILDKHNITYWDTDEFLYLFKRAIEDFSIIDSFSSGDISNFVTEAYKDNRFALDIITVDRFHYTDFAHYHLALWVYQKIKDEDF